MIYCNPIPIAAGCFLEQNVVKDGLKVIFDAIYNLISIGQNVFLKNGFYNINFIQRNLTYPFSPETINMVKYLPSSEAKFKKGITPIKFYFKYNVRKIEN